MQKSCVRQMAGIAVLLGLLFAPLHVATATTRTWNGPVSGDWFTAGNWNPSDNYPLDGDDVVVTSSSILLTNSTAQLSSFTITNATVTFTNWTTALNATNITIWNNGFLAHAVCTTNGGLAVTNRIVMFCSNLNVYAGGFIDANSSGYTGRYAMAGMGNGGGGGGSTGCLRRRRQLRRKWRQRFVGCRADLRFCKRAGRIRQRGRRGLRHSGKRRRRDLDERSRCRARQRNHPRRRRQRQRRPSRCGF